MNKKRIVTNPEDNDGVHSAINYLMHSKSQSILARLEDHTA